jgi:hypothetical protein
VGDYVVLNEVNPSDDLLRRWAFDENLLLMDQDEDVILACDEHIPVLCELIADPACPKGDYIGHIISIWARDEALMELGWGRKLQPGRFAAARDVMRRLAVTSAAATELFDYLSRLDRWLTTGPRNLTEVAACLRDLARDRYDGLEEDRWKVHESDGLVTARLPYGAPSLSWWQIVAVDLVSGRVTVELEHPPRP